MSTITIIRRDKAVSVTDGRDWRVADCATVDFAISLEACLRSDLDGARYWMLFQVPEEYNLPSRRSNVVKFRRPDDQV